LPKTVAFTMVLGRAEERFDFGETVAFATLAGSETGWSAIRINPNTLWSKVGPRGSSVFTRRKPGGRLGRPGPATCRCKTCVVFVFATTVTPALAVAASTTVAPTTSQYRRPSKRFRHDGRLRVAEMVPISVSPHRRGPGRTAPSAADFRLRPCESKQGVLKKA